MERVAEPVPEVAVRLSANGEVLATWTCSPTDLEALGAGRLLALGFLVRRSDLLAIHARPPGVGSPLWIIETKVAEAAMTAGLREREHRHTHGCGLRHMLDCDSGPAERPVRAATPDLDAFPGLFRELFDRSPSRRTTGGHHTAALTDGTGLSHVFEEVGRHNGVDKAIGAALLAGEDVGSLGLLTTARISGEIAEKAVRAGIGWVASRSVPTTLAADLAAAHGVPLVARAAGRDVRVFAAGAGP